jgi:DNA-binding MarR family transcriptional regulator
VFAIHLDFRIREFVSVGNVMVDKVETSELAGMRVLPTLTQRQAEVLTFLGRYFQTNRDYPTQREIADHFGVSQNAAALHLVALSKKNYVVRLPGERRNIRLTELALEKLRMIGEEVGAQRVFGF